MDFVTEDAITNCSNLLEDEQLSTVYNYVDSVPIDPTINFLFNGIGILLLAVFGITANLLSVVVLSHRNLKSSLTTLLLGLTISDIFVIGTFLLIYSLSQVLRQFNIFSSYTTYILPHLMTWLLPITYTAQMSSVYFTVIITMERYIAVCLPLRSRSLCTRSTAQKSALIVVLVSILYNIPRWFEYQTVPESNGEEAITYKVATLKQRAGYLLYYVNWGYLVVINLVPFTILLYFNIAIYLVQRSECVVMVTSTTNMAFENFLACVVFGGSCWVKKQRSQRSTLSPTMANKQNEDMQLAGMLFGIVITSFLCNMLDPVMVVTTTLGTKVTGDLLPIANFLIVCNSSTNFVFYCVFGTEFRRRLKQILNITPSDDKRERTSSSVSDVTSTSIDFSYSVITLACQQHLEPAPSLPNSSTRF